MKCTMKKGKIIYFSLNFINIINNSTIELL